MNPTFAIEPLSKRHDPSAFDCGDARLNNFLRRFARQNDERGLGWTFVALVPTEAAIRGYYTLLGGPVTFDIVPENLPRYPVPVADLGRLAVDLGARGCGLGALLLVDALRRAALAADQLGIHAVEVVAKTPEARAFYMNYGFTSLLDDELHLYLPMRVIRRLRLVDPR